MNKLMSDLITNKCIIVCDLKKYKNKNSKCWEILKGSKDEIGKSLVEFLDGIKRLDDFGGVAKSFLCDDNGYYIDNPPKLKDKHSAIFSFTPKNKAIEEAQSMAKSAQKSGYQLMILTIQKKGHFGKVWTLESVMKHSQTIDFTYLEDTNTIVDEIKKYDIVNELYVVHIVAPGFEDFKSELANHTMTQEEYKKITLQ